MSLSQTSALGWMCTSCGAPGVPPAQSTGQCLVEEDQRECMSSIRLCTYLRPYESDKTAVRRIVSADCDGIDLVHSAVTVSCV